MIETKKVYASRVFGWNEIVHNGKVWIVVRAKTKYFLARNLLLIAANEEMPKRLTVPIWAKLRKVIE